MFKNFTRYGQTVMHKCLMTLQVLKKILFLMGFGWLIVFGIFVWTQVPSRAWYNSSAYVTAQIKTHHYITSNPEYVMQTYDGVETYSDIIKKDKSIVNQALAVWLVLQRAFWYGLLLNVLLLLIIYGGFNFRGKAQSKTKHVRGTRLVKPKKLRRRLMLTFKASKIEISGLPLIKNSETEHILVSGVSGAGKTTLILILLKFFRLLGWKILIVDTTGSFVEKFYRPGDKILNPFDKRCDSWTFWGECTEEPHYEAVMKSAIKSDGNIENGDFWTGAARTMVAELLREMHKRGNTSNKELARHLFFDKVPELKGFLDATPAGRYVQEEAGKMPYNILAHLMSPLQLIRYLPDTDTPFSIRKWVTKQNDDSWLFITSKESHLDLMRPMISMWVDCAKNALIDLGEDKKRKRRMGFVFDELPSLGKLNGLVDFLLKGRKYGACVISGFQSLPSIEKHYGNNTSKEVVDNHGTKVFCRTTEEQTSKAISSMLGEEEVIECQEQISLGPHEVKGSTTYTQNRVTRSVVLPTEIQKLPKLTAYVMLPGEYPVTKIKIIPEDMPQRAEFYIPNEEVGLVISHDKFAKDLEKTYEEAFSMDDIIDGELVIEDKSGDAEASSDGASGEDVPSAGVDPKSKAENDSESKDVEDKSDDDVLASAFDVTDDAIILTLEDGKQITVGKDKFDKKDISKSDLAFVKNGSVLMVSGHMNPINEIVCNHEIDYAEIVSVDVGENCLCVGLSSNKMLEVKLDALGVSEGVSKDPQTSECKKILIWGEKQVKLEEMVTKGKFV